MARSACARSSIARVSVLACVLFILVWGPPFVFSFSKKKMTKWYYSGHFGHSSKRLKTKAQTNKSEYSFHRWFVTSFLVAPTVSGPGQCHARFFFFFFNSPLSLCQCDGCASAFKMLVFYPKRRAGSSLRHLYTHNILHMLVHAWACTCM